MIFSGLEIHMISEPRQRPTFLPAEEVSQLQAKSDTSHKVAPYSKWAFYSSTALATVMIVTSIALDAANVFAHSPRYAHGVLDFAAISLLLFTLGGIELVRKKVLIPGAQANDKLLKDIKLRRVWAAYQDHIKTRVIDAVEKSQDVRAARFGAQNQVPQKFVPEITGFEVPEHIEAQLKTLTGETPATARERYKAASAINRNLAPTQKIRPGENIRVVMERTASINSSIASFAMARLLKPEPGKA